VLITQIVQVNPEKVRWTGSAVASYMETSGNSVNRNASIMADAVRRSEDTRTTANAGYFHSQQKADSGMDETTADNFFFGGKFDYFWSKQFYSYANARYYKDKILDLDHRLTTGLGLGYQWVETDSWNIFTELGATYVDEKYSLLDGKDTYLSARGAYHVAKNFGERVSLFHNLEILENLDTTSAYLVTTDAGLRAQLTERWFMEGRVMFLYNSEPPADQKKDDTRYTVGLGLKF
jgi:putative salt-induced outer membrane protein YdiY